jgi:hypothetical protein
MTNEEILDELTKTTAALVPVPVVPVKDLKELYHQLVLSQLTAENLEELDFTGKAEDFKAVLFADDYKAVIKGKGYADYLKLVLDKFKPAKTGPYKKFAQIAYRSAKYLMGYPSLDSYKKHVTSGLRSGDDHGLSYLDSFRHESSLSGMFLVRTCRFFQQSGLGDVPVPDSAAKAYLMPRLTLPDDNGKIYLALYQLAKAGHCSCAELDQRIQAFH